MPVMTKAKVKQFALGALVAALGAGSYVIAAVTFNDFQSGTTISASEMNAKLNSLKDAVNTLEAKLGEVGSNKLVPGKNGVMAYVWANNATSASYTPSPQYSFNSTGGAITITRSSAGAYEVLFAGLAANGVGISGNVQVTAYNSAAYCSVQSWVPSAVNAADLSVFVNCRDTAGTAVDSRFTALFIG